MSLQYFAAPDIGSALAGLGILIFSVIMVLVLFKMWMSLLRVIEGQESKHYRKYLVNLYVAGKVRQIAEADKVDLDKEGINFKKYFALNNKGRAKDLDEKIEQELMEKVEKENTKEIPKQ